MIYLQWLDSEADYKVSEEVTWCKDDVNRSDIPYIRNDIYMQLVHMNSQLQETITKLAEETERCKTALFVYKTALFIKNQEG